MGNYRPRPVEVKQCKNCGISFDTNHKRTMYCGESCRQLAYQARHQSDQPEPRKAKGSLSFSAQNIAVIAASTAVTAVGNYVLNDGPFYEKLNKRLDSLEGKLGRQSGAASVDRRMFKSFINAVRKNMPEVDRIMQLDEQQMRTELQQAKQLLKQS